MKKKSVLNLIKYYAENNDTAFRNEAYEIAKEFDETGDYQLAEYITALLSGANSFVPQDVRFEFKYLEKVKINNSIFPIPEEIENDIRGIINSIKNNVGVNKFLFQGEPGTGKTECVKQISRILERELYSVNFSNLIDSKLGQTQKNINDLFSEINSCPFSNRIVILFDEIDSLAMDRTNYNDVREMGRTTSALLKSLDSLKDDITIIATTNLYKHFDKALIRRFDYVVDFNRYTLEDLIDVGNALIDEFLKKYKMVGKNSRLSSKIFRNMNPILMPGDLKNAIKSSLAFSNKNEEFDYLKRLFVKLCGKNDDIKDLQDKGFTVREIEILTGFSKSKVGRDLKEDNDE